MDVAIIAAMDEEVATASRPAVPGTGSGSVPSWICPFTGARMLGLDTVYRTLRHRKSQRRLGDSIHHRSFQTPVILTSGVAGAISPEVRIGDVVIATGAQQHDLDARGFGYAQWGVIPGWPQACSPRIPIWWNWQRKQPWKSWGLSGYIRAWWSQAISLSVPGSRRRKSSGFSPGPCAPTWKPRPSPRWQRLNGIPYLSLQAISDQADEEAGQAFYQTLDEVLAGLNQSC